MNTALIIIDMLNDFVLEEAPLRTPGAKDIIPCIQKEKSEAVKNKNLVIYLCDSHDPDDEEFKIWPKHCIKGTKGAEIIEELKPSDDDIIIEKTRYSGFFNTNLDDVLKEKNIKNLILTGLLTNVCVMYTAADAVSRNYHVIVPENCVTALDEETHRFALNQLKNVHNAEIR